MSSTKYPSRSISWPLRMYILVGGVPSIMWVVSMVVALVVASVLLPAAAPMIGPTYDRHHEGEIVAVEKTGTEILNRPVMAVDATFADDHGTSLRVRSYGSARTVGARVIVHYQSAQPERAVIDGMRTHEVPWWLMPAGYVVCVAMGAAVPLWGMRDRRRALELLRSGQHATGKIVDVQTHGSGEDRRWVATIELATADQRTVRFEARSGSKRDFRVGESEPLVYDAAAPSGAQLLSALPGKPVIDGERVRFG